MKHLRIVIVIAGTAVLLAACHKFTGGGWIEGMNGGKAHFGFTAQCEDLNPGVALRGQLQFNDKSAGVKFHGKFENYYFEDESCDALVASWAGSENGIDAVGSCRSQPEKNEGTFELVAWDNDADGYPDTISIAADCTSDGEFYVHGGELQGGNITSHAH